MASRSRRAAAAQRGGLARLAQFVERDLGWIFRAQPRDPEVPDSEGVNAHVEVVEGGDPTGRLIAMHVRGAADPGVEREGGDFVVTFDGADPSYWLKHSLPVVVVVADADGRWFWREASSGTLEQDGGRSKLRVSTTSETSSARPAWIRIAAAGSEYQTRLNRLVLDRWLMQLLASGGSVCLDVDEWVHKGSGRGRFAIVRVDGDQDRVLQEWTEFATVAYAASEWGPRLFPWADLRPSPNKIAIVDMEAIEAWLGGHDAAGYSEPEVPLDEVYRPHNMPGTETIVYRTALSLNRLGRAFVVLDRHLAES